MIPSQPAAALQLLVTFASLLKCGMDVLQGKEQYPKVRKPAPEAIHGNRKEMGRQHRDAEGRQHNRQPGQSIIPKQIIAEKRFTNEVHTIARKLQAEPPG